MRKIAFVSAMLAASAAYAADATYEPSPPTTLAVIACRVDDLTGQPGRHGVDAEGVYHEEWAGKGWRDYEWHRDPQTFEVQCKREVLELQDAVEMLHPEVRKLIPLDPNWSDRGQCSMVSMGISGKWNEAHKGWAIMAIGCPTKVTVGGPEGPVKDYAIPGCPNYVPGTQERMKCVFDETGI